MHALSKFFRKYVLANLPLKIMALAIAIMLWWTVGHDQNIEMLVTVPLELRHAPTSMEIDSDAPLEALVTVSGPQRLLERMSAHEVHAVIDVAGASVGERTFDVSFTDIHAPRDVKIVQVTPTQFHVNFAPTMSRTVAVKPRVMGSLLSGYTVAQVSADPPTVTITGPEEHVKATEHVVTDPVDASGLVGQATFTTHAYLGDPLLHVQNPKPIHVTVITERTPGTAEHP